MTLSEFKVSRKLKLADLAALFGGMPISTVHGWVRGTRTPGLADALRIEQATGGAVRPADLMQTQASAA